MLRHAGRNRRLSQSVLLVALLYLVPYDLDHRSYGLVWRSKRRHWTPKTLLQGAVPGSGAPPGGLVLECVAALWQPSLEARRLFEMYEQQV